MRSRRLASSVNSEIANVTGWIVLTTMLFLNTMDVRILMLIRSLAMVVQAFAFPKRESRASEQSRLSDLKTDETLQILGSTLLTFAFESSLFWLASETSPAIAFSAIMASRKFGGAILSTIFVTDVPKQEDAFDAMSSLLASFSVLSGLVCGLIAEDAMFSIRITIAFTTCTCLAYVQDRASSKISFSGPHSAEKFNAGATLVVAFSTFLLVLPKFEASVWTINAVGSYAIVSVAMFVAGRIRVLSDDDNQWPWKISALVSVFFLWMGRIENSDTFCAVVFTANVAFHAVEIAIKRSKIERSVSNNGDLEKEEKEEEEEGEEDEERDQRV